MSLKKQGKTVFFSTHIIPDVEVICTKVGIVAKGRMVRMGTVSELLAETAESKTEVLVEGLKPDFVPKGAGETVSAGGRRLFVVESAAGVRDFVQEIFAAGGSLVSVNQRRASLEDHVVRIVAQGKPS